MFKLIILSVIVAILAFFTYGERYGPETVARTATDAGTVATADNQAKMPDRAVLDITVHTIEEMRVLMDRAEELADSLHDDSRGDSVVLVLHGPEVEFFSTRNYQRYKEIVDQAARLDALDIVDVKICQTMMDVKGIARDDIPPFIEQVPNGDVEIERLLTGGYVYF